MIDEKNVPMTLIACIGLIVSGTRANVIILLAYLSYRFFFYNKKKSKIKVLLSVLFIAVIVFNFPTIIDAFTDIMNKKGSLKSDAIRGGLMNSYKSIFSNVKILLFGMGYSAAFYNYGTQSYAIAGEYSYLELIRQVGIICFALFMMFIIYPLISKIDNSKKFVYIGYLIIAYTNPLLFSSTAFAAYIYMYILVYEKNICTKDNNRGDKLNEKNSVCV